MRRFLLCASVAAAAIALPAAAMAAQPAFTTTDLNLRAGPGTAYPVVDTLPGGTRLRIQGCIAGYNWCSIVWRGEYGWVQGDYLAALYRGRRVVVIDEGPEIGLPIISFNIGPYWHRHYRHRGFYARRDSFHGGHFAARGGDHDRHNHARAVMQNRARVTAAPVAAPRTRQGTVGLAAPAVQHGHHHFAGPRSRDISQPPHNAGMNFGHRGPGPRRETTGAAPHAAPAMAAPAVHAAPVQAPAAPHAGGPGHGGPGGGHGPGGPGHDGPHRH
jgi:uncharacterized protein YraI